MKVTRPDEQKAQETPTAKANRRSNRAKKVAAPEALVAPPTPPVAEFPAEDEQLKAMAEAAIKNQLQHRFTNGSPYITGTLNVRKCSKVAIVGFASHWAQTNFDDPELEIWALNEFYDVAPEQLKKPLAEGRVRWFEIHGRESEYEGNPFFHSRNKSNEHAAKMAGLVCPVYMQQHWDDVPLSIPYPKDAMISAFGDYFTNSISWMMALAISEGFKEIQIYGVDMAQNLEYASQRPSCEYFMGIARACGIRLVLPPESDLGKASYLYGFEQPKVEAFRVKMLGRKKELTDRLNQVRGQMGQLQCMEQQLMGALENTEYSLGVWAAK